MSFLFFLFFSIVVRHNITNNVIIILIPLFPGTGKRNRDAFVVMHNAKKGNKEVEQEKQKMMKDAKAVEKKLTSLGVKYQIPEPVCCLLLFLFFIFISFN